MKKVIWSYLFISLLFLLSCNNSSDDKKIKDNLVKNKQEEVKDDSHNQKDMTPLEQGQYFANQAQKVLAGNLMNVINTKGTVAALTFCSVKANILTDSMALELNIRLKRVSDKPRNSSNMATKEELKYITNFKKILKNEKKIKPQIIEKDGKIIGYYPIITNKICMQCHGNQDTEILPETLFQIKKLYPDDKGIDNKTNELRGIWVVEMGNK